MSQIIKGYNKKIFQEEKQEALDCNCRVKTDFPLNGGCRKERVIYKCTATTCDTVNELQLLINWCVYIILVTILEDHSSGSFE